MGNTRWRIKFIRAIIWENPDDDVITQTPFTKLQREILSECWNCCITSMFLVEENSTNGHIRSTNSCKAHISLIIAHDNNFLPTAKHTRFGSVRLWNIWNKNFRAVSFGVEYIAHTFLQSVGSKDNTVSKL